MLDLGGTIRTSEPRETLRRLMSAKGRYGITRIADVTGLDCIGLPVANCFRPLARHLTVSQGKGITAELARISALMESIEGYFLERPHKLECRGSFNEVARSARAVDPVRAGYCGPLGNRIADMPIEWVEATELTGGHALLFPRAATFLDLTRQPQECDWFKVSSNGIAAGNSEAEATCHALLELLERHLISMWVDAPIAERTRCEVETLAVTDPVNRGLLDRYAKAGIKVRVWNISAGCAVAAYHCVIEDPAALHCHILYSGTGAHIVPRIALARALSEAAQARLTYITGSREDIESNHYDHGYMPPGANLPVADEKAEYFPDHGQWHRDFVSVLDVLLRVSGEIAEGPIIRLVRSDGEDGIYVVQLFGAGFLFHAGRI